jgi:hypothetical protein
MRTTICIKGKGPFFTPFCSQSRLIGIDTVREGMVFICLPGITPQLYYFPRYPQSTQLQVGLQVEKSSVTRFEPATIRFAVMRPTTFGKMALKVKIPRNNGYAPDDGWYPYTLSIGVSPVPHTPSPLRPLQ